MFIGVCRRSQVSVYRTIWSSGLLSILDTGQTFLLKGNFCFDLQLTIPNGFVTSKIYDKRDDFDLDIVNFPFSDGDVPRRASYGVYVSQLIRFARVCNHV